MDGEGTIKAKSERLGAKAMANFFGGDTQNILFANSGLQKNITSYYEGALRTLAKT